MFDNLIESGKKRTLKQSLGNNAVSVIVHILLITLAIKATLHAGEAVEDRIQQIAMTIQQEAPPENEPPPPPPEQIATVNPPPQGFQTLSIPTSIPVDIPPPSQTTHFDAADFSGVGVEGGIAAGVVGGTGPVISDQPYLEAVVEERPDAISGTCIPPRFPEMLQRAGIEGRVLLEFVIDTTGRAERGTLRVVSTSHQLFEAPAREAVTSCRFRPGRIQGRAVRVRVQQSVNFTIAR